MSAGPLPSPRAPKRSFPPIVDEERAGPGPRHAAGRGIIASPGILRPSAQFVLADPVRACSARRRQRIMRTRLGFAEARRMALWDVCEWPSARPAPTRRSAGKSRTRSASCSTTHPRSAPSPSTAPPPAAFTTAISRAARPRLSGAAVDKPGPCPARFRRQARPLGGAARGSLADAPTPKVAMA